jgi:S-adenosylmethionine:tRNA ribosyltransferase-isomerase
MRVDLFDFDLPRKYIADRPASPRDSARLLDLTGDGFADRIMRDLPNCLQPGDLLIANNTKVIPARLDGLRGDVKIEATLHMRTGDDEWLAFAKPGKRLKVGQHVDFADGFRAEVVEKRERGDIRFKFNCGGEELFQCLEKYGRMPLPPYIQRKRDDAQNTDDLDNYQTVFAREEGGGGAPPPGPPGPGRRMDGVG